MAASKTMKAIDIRKDTNPPPASALFINPNTPMPTPSADQVLVRIHAFGLNRMDLLQRLGQYPVPPQAPSTLGVEFSGEIVAVGDAVAAAAAAAWSEQEKNETAGKEESAASATPSTTTRHAWRTGDAVFGLAYGGAYAEYIAVSGKMVIRKPASLSWAQAAAVPEVWMTASQALFEVGGYGAGKSVLWHAGASSVSIAGMQLARAEGASAVYATVRQDAKAAYVREHLGCDEAWNVTRENWVEGVKGATGGKGVDLIVDFVGAPNWKDNLDAIARDGRIVLLGFMGGSEIPGPVDIKSILMKRVRIEGSTLRSRDVEYQARLRDTLEDHALPKMIDGSFKIVVEKEFDWSNIVQAHEQMERNETKGKLVCNIPWE